MMQTRELLIRCLMKREGDQWVAICLPFDLAAQGSSPKDVRSKLESQIFDYLTDALCGQDREHAEHLLSRRAPLVYWAEYAWAVLSQKIHAFKSSMRGYRAVVPLAPAHC
jgi:hypothetical protein